MKLLAYIALCLAGLAYLVYSDAPKWSYIAVGAAGIVGIGLGIRDGLKNGASGEGPADGGEGLRA